MTRILVYLLRVMVILIMTTVVEAQTMLTTTEVVAEPAKSANVGKTRQLRIANQPWIGDFDRMIERRIIRIYVPYSRSLYFVDKGRERGIAADLIRDFERWVNQKYAKKLGKRPLTIYIVAATRDRLLADLNDGLADIAVGNLTVTEERLKVVDFIAPDEKITNIERLSKN
ncbi:MAG: transporter substrate-binding domain-containing protein [Candidatus Competibacteraceae bacterium]|nr:MAG: transporter substrate-binding domain-containing protein [Candidatus Competibacteraceae bacterium]